MEKEEDKYMDKYARSLAGQGQKISPEDSDYKEKLIHVVQSFRTFDVALDDFILHHGYTRGTFGYRWENQIYKRKI